MSDRIPDVGKKVDYGAEPRCYLCGFDKLLREISDDKRICQFCEFKAIKAGTTAPCPRCGGHLYHVEPDTGWTCLNCKVTDAVNAGVKHDTGKLRVDLLPVDALEAVAGVLKFGAAKYGERNWERGMAWSRVYGSLLRHLWAWWREEKLDTESGLPHLHHALCCLLFLVAYDLRGVGVDDRPDAQHAP